MSMTHWKKSYIFIPYLGVGLLLLLMLAGFVPQPKGNSIRHDISKDMLQLGPDDLPKIMANTVPWSLHAPLNHNFLSFENEGSFSNEHASDAWIDFVEDSVALQTTQGAKNVELSLRYTSRMVPLPTAEVAFNLGLPVNYGEAFNVEGHPIRWAEAQSVSNTAVTTCEVQPESFALVQDSLLSNLRMRYESTYERAKRYHSLVANAARKYNLRESLIFAIIQTESDFSPRLVSSQSAMGLMQLLPSTAGGEVHKYLYGHSATMTLDDLAKPDLNILFGTTYVHLLMTRHLAGIEDANSRQYCALAAYNMGPGRLIRFFGDGRSDAIANINSLSSDEVYRRLTQVLPIAETRNYVSRVTRRQAKFEDLL